MKRQIITIISIAAIQAGVWAQDLHTEITVDRTVQPELRNISRPQGFNPELISPNIKPKYLNAAEYTGSGIITDEISVLPAASWADSIARTPYRGYATVGYLPLYNVLGNIGYRLLDADKYGLGLWAQYLGYGYNGDIPYFDGAKFANHFFTVGGDAHYRVNSYSVLSASGKVNLASVRSPYFFLENGMEHRRSYFQHQNDIYGQLNWQSRIGMVAYNIGGALRYFQFGNDLPSEISSILLTDKQAGGDINFGVGLLSEDKKNKWIGIDVDFALLKSRNIPHQVSYSIQYGTLTQYETNLHPYLRFDANSLQGRVGANVSIAGGDVKHVKVAPEVSVEISPSQKFCAFAKAYGGEHINYMSDIFEINPYVVPFLAYGRTNIPLVIEGGFASWPIQGLKFGIKGGYAIAKDLLSPAVTILRNGLMRSSFYSDDVNSWYVGAEATYSYSNLFTVDLGVRYADSNSDAHSWYEWIDAAQVVANASVTCSPIQPLDVTLGFELRSKRRAQSLIYPYDSYTSEVYVGIPNLGNIRNLNLSAKYRISPQLTAFLSLENLLNYRYRLISCMPAERLKGLIGASYKF